MVIHPTPQHLSSRKFCLDAESLRCHSNATFSLLRPTQYFVDLQEEATFKLIQLPTIFVVIELLLRIDHLSHFSHASRVPRDKIYTAAHEVKHVCRL